MRQGFLGLLLVSSMTWIAGCAQPPTAEVDSARAALDAVAEEGAAYLPEQYQAAQDRAAALDAELQGQEGGFALFRSYDRASELAAALQTAADDMRQAIETEKQRLREEAGRMVADARTAVSEARESLDVVPEDDATALESDLAAVEASLGNIDGLLTGGQLTEAHREAEAALQTATRVNTSIAEVQAAIAETQEVQAERAARGDVDIPRAVMLDGTPLAVGNYQVRVTDEEATPVSGETGGNTRWVEFVRDGAVAGRGLAIAIPDAEIGEVAKSPPPRNEVRVTELRGGEYVRVWVNRDGANYLVYMPIESR